MRFEHFVHLERALDDGEQRVLRALLDYGGGAARADGGGQRLYVVPRLGTISPWASKATDIAKLCALPVRRVERGRVYELAARAALAREELERIGPLLHDRMTETLLEQPPRESTLFADHEPRAARAIDPPISPAPIRASLGMRGICAVILSWPRGARTSKDVGLAADAAGSSR